MGITSLFEDRRNSLLKSEEVKCKSFDGWQRCPSCDEMLHDSQIEGALYLCPKCAYHYRMPLDLRIQLLTDEGTAEELFKDILPTDPLSFNDGEPYSAKLSRAMEATGRSEAIWTGVAALERIPYALAVMDFSFMGGSMGSVVGERLTCLIEEATKRKIPLLIVSASGGARMQESIFSLMQMAKTSAALGRFKEAGLFYLSLLTHPTTGGVSASFATLGDLIFAEPGALICFAGPRVIEKTTGEKLPSGAQRAEFLVKRGMVDMTVSRQDLSSKIAFFLKFFSYREPHGTSSTKSDNALHQNRSPSSSGENSPLCHSGSCGG